MIVVYKVNTDINFSESVKVNNLVKEHLQIICNQVLKNMPENLHSLILTGAATQGEGSAIVSKNRIRVLSDYDVLVVVEDRDLSTLREKLRHLSFDLTKILREKGLLSCVELHATTKSGLASLIPTIANINLKDSGTVLYGEDVSSLIPHLSPQEIPKWDALKILFNRSCEQLLYIHPNFFYKNKIPNHILELNVYQTAKTYLDVCTSLLAFHGSCAPTYSKRINEFKRLINRTASLKEFIPSNTFFEKWLDFKKNPNLQTLTKIYLDSELTLQELCLKAWIVASELVFTVLTYEISSLLNRVTTSFSFDIDHILDLTDTIFKNGKKIFNVYKREILSYITANKWSCISHPIRTMKILISQISPRALMYLSLLLVNFSTKFIMERDILGDRLLNCSRDYFLSIPHIKLPVSENALSSWNKLRIEGLKLWSELFTEPFFENDEDDVYFLTSV